MIWRLLRILERVLAALAAGVAVVAGFGLWLYTRGPISLDSIAPDVARILSRENGLAATVDHTLVSLGEDGRIAILARGVHLSRQAGGAQLTLAELSLEFSLRAALSRVIAPTRIIVTGPALRLDRDPEGAFHLGIGELSADAAEDWGRQILGDLVRPPDGRGTVGYLTELTVRDASLTVDDRSLGVEWHADGAEASLLRSADRTSGNFRLTARQGPITAAFAGDYTYLPSDGQLVVGLSFSDVNPAQWAAAAPEVAAIGALDLPVSGEVTAELDPAQLTLRDATWDLSFGAGSLKSPLLPGGALALADARLDGGYDPAQGRINLGLLQLDPGQGEATVSGTIDGVGAQVLSGVLPQTLDLNLAIETRGIKTDDLPRLWPEGSAVFTREWVVQHLHDGTLDDAQARFAAHLDFSPDAPKLAQILQFDGTMSFSGLSVEYFRPMPPARNIVGTAKFNRTEIDFAATGGTLGNIKATGGTARFYQLDTHDEQGKIEVLGQGPLADALAVLDTAPLYYARDAGLDAARATGEFSARVDVALPLIHHLPLSLVEYSADATLTGVGLGGILFGRDLSDGELKLKIDHTAAEADGTAKIAGVPVAMSWRQSLDPHAAARTRYDVKAHLDDAQRAGLGLDALVSGIAAATGTVGVDASYTLAAQKRGAASVALDLTDAALAVAKLDWRKPAGVPAQASIELDLNDDKVAGIRAGLVNGGGMNAAFSASFDHEGLSGITVGRMVAGDTDVHGSLTRDAQGGWRLSAAGPSLDLSGVMDSLDQAPAANESERALSLEAKIGRVILGPDRQARDVTAALASDGAHWRQATVDLQLSDRTKANLTFGDATGGRRFKLTTNDFGALLKLLGVTGHVVGGTFQLTGQAEDRGGKRVLVGQADGANYRLVEAPALARLLSLASLSGIGALLSGEGIPFTRLEAGVILGTDSMAVNDLRAYGGAIGINLSGTVDRVAGQMDVSGTLVPAYTLNNVLGNIPVLGNLLLGGAGQGIFAANFRLAGPIDDPRVSVNPLSALAPGILRKLFLFEPGNP